MKSNLELGEGLKASVTRSFRSAEQAQRYFAKQQHALQLHEILDPNNLVLKSFRVDTFRRLDALESLLAEHKQFYSSSVVSFNKDLLNVMSETGELDFQHFLESNASQVETKVHEQAKFFHARQVWIDSARTLIQILDDHEDLYVFDGDTFQFEDDELLERFQDCIDRMDESAKFEKEFVQSRKASVISGLNRLWGAFKR